MSSSQSDALALILAVKRGQLAEVGRLLSEGVPANSRIGDGRSPMFVAAERGDVQMIRFLLASGADVNLGQESGFTPLFAAVLSSHPSAVEALLAAGANPFGPGGQPISTFVPSGDKHKATENLLREAEMNWRDSSS